MRAGSGGGKEGLLRLKAGAGVIQAKGLVVLVCGAQVLVQIGAYFWPALLPGMMQRWALSNSEAGWITAIFYGAYMLSVPVLITLTDRKMMSRAITGHVAGIGISGALSYMMGDLIADRLGWQAAFMMPGASHDRDPGPLAARPEVRDNAA